MEFIELAEARYSVRDFSAKEVEKEKIEAILLAGRVAPTAKNQQPQKIIVMQSKEAVEKIRSVCSCAYNAPTVLAVCYDGERDWKNPFAPGVRSGEVDASIVCTHMMLAAAANGLGSCWVGWFDPEKVAEALELPENIHPVALLPIGYPAEDAKPSERHTLYRDYDDTIEWR